MRGFDPKYLSLTQIDEQVELMKNCVKTTNVESLQLSSDLQMYHSPKALYSFAQIRSIPSISMRSKSSIKLAVAKIQAAEVCRFRNKSALSSI